MNRRKIFIILGSIFLVLFTFFSWSVKRGAFRNIDFAFTVKVQDMIDKSPRLRLSRMVGEVMEGSTFLASPEVSVIGVLVLTILSYLTLRFIDTSKWTWKKWIVIGSIPLMFSFLVLAEIYGKSVVHHPAPPFFMIKNPTTIFPKYYINDEFSYPSGHAARAVFLAIVIFFILNTRYLIRDASDHLRKKKALIIGMVLFISISLVSISRIYLGHHWLSDIIGGLFLGGGLGFFAVAGLSLRTDD